MKYNSFLKLILFGFVCALIATSCVKEGPTGPAGADGKDGKDGADGLNGTDGTASCIVCHSNNQVIYAMEQQYEASFHAEGEAFARNTGECAVCHTSQGFIGNIDGSYDWTAPGAMIENPNRQNCYTCHNIHKTYTSDDLALTVTGAIEIQNTGGKTHDYGKGSVCASCHQGRTVNPFPVAGGPDITVSNTRYGVHHGPMANTVGGVGMGLFEVGSGLVNSAHANIENTCVTCHMGTASGLATGGHTLNMNFSNCSSTACHPAGENLTTLVEELQTEVTASLAELKTLLDAKGITKPGSDNSVAGTYPAVVAGACLDYKALVEDKSFGVHNPKYIKQLIENLKVELSK